MTLPTSPVARASSRSRVVLLAEPRDLLERRMRHAAGSSPSPRPRRARAPRRRAGTRRYLEIGVTEPSSSRTSSTGVASRSATDSSAATAILVPIRSASDFVVGEREPRQDVAAGALEEDAFAAGRRADDAAQRPREVGRVDVHVVAGRDRDGSRSRRASRSPTRRGGAPAGSSPGCRRARRGSSRGSSRRSSRPSVRSRRLTATSAAAWPQTTRGGLEPLDRELRPTETILSWITRANASTANCASSSSSPKIAPWSRPPVGARCVWLQLSRIPSGAAPVAAATRSISGAISGASMPTMSTPQRITRVSPRSSAIAPTSSGRP